MEIEIAHTREVKFIKPMLTQFLSEEVRCELCGQTTNKKDMVLMKNNVIHKECFQSNFKEINHEKWSDEQIHASNEKVVDFFKCKNKSLS